MDKIDIKLKDTIEKNLGSELEFTPIGHHELGRHLVYSVKDQKNNEFILKIYGIVDRWCKEIVSLNLMKRKILCPKIIAKGKLDNGTEWVIMSKIPGVILEKVWDQVTEENRKELLEKLGEILSTIHNNSRYSYFGPWKDCGPGVVNHLDFLEYRKSRDKKIINEISKQNLPQKDFLMEVYKKMIKYYNEIYAQEYTCMCHHDYSPRNTLVVKKNGKWQISGIIDFEHSYPNDPDIDFTDYYQNIFINNPKYEYYFLKGYTMNRELTKNFDKKVKYYLHNKGLLICSWAYEFAPDYYKEGMNLLHWLMDKNEKYN